MHELSTHWDFHSVLSSFFLGKGGETYPFEAPSQFYLHCKAVQIARLAKERLAPTESSVKTFMEILVKVVRPWFCTQAKSLKVLTCHVFFIHFNIPFLYHMSLPLLLFLASSFFYCPCLLKLTFRAFLLCWVLLVDFSISCQLMYIHLGLDLGSLVKTGLPMPKFGLLTLRRSEWHSRNQVLLTVVKSMRCDTLVQIQLYLLYVKGKQLTIV